MLVAISIPIFTSQLDKAKAATDQANVRGWYAQEVAKILDSDTYTGPSGYTGPELKIGTASVSGSGDNFSVTYTTTVAGKSFTVGGSGGSGSGGSGGGSGS